MQRSKRNLLRGLLLIFLSFSYISFYFHSNKHQISATKQLPSSTSNHSHGSLVQTNYDIMKNLQMRVSHVLKECMKLNHTKQLDFNTLRSTNWPWIYVSHKYKLLYCQTPKAGTTNWLKVFGLLEGNGTADDVDPHSVHFTMLSYLKEKERRRAMKDYTKFMVVREPFERVISAYKDKFIPKPGFKNPVFVGLGKEIIKNYRGLFAIETFREPHIEFTPTFQEFVAYITDRNNFRVTSHYSEPRHWQPQNELCYPCNIHYDYIMDIESINNESDVLLQYLKVPGNVRYPKIERSYKSEACDEGRYKREVCDYFSRIDPGLTNALYHYYKTDYQLFDFERPPQF